MASRKILLFILVIAISLAGCVGPLDDSENGELDNIEENSPNLQDITVEHDNEEIFVNDEVTFTPVVEGDLASFDYDWDFDDGITSDDISPTHSYDESGIYTVELTVTDQESELSSSQSVDVEVVEEDDGNGLGPDGDYELEVFAQDAQDQSPMENVNINVIDSETMETLHSGATDEWGIYETVIPHGELTIEAEAEGYETQTETLVVDSDEIVQFEMEPS